MAPRRFALHKIDTAMKEIPGMPFGRSAWFSPAEMQRRRNLVQDAAERVGADVVLAFRQSRYTDPLLLWLDGQRERPEASVFVLKDGILHQPGKDRRREKTDPCLSPYLTGCQEELKALLTGCKKLAFIGLGNLDLQFHAFLQELCPGARYVDITPAVTRCRAVKSPEEIQAVLEAVYVHDKVFEALPEFVYPGRRERDIASDIIRTMERCGADFTGFDGIIPHTVYIEMGKGAGVKADSDAAAMNRPIKWPGQLLREDDWFQLCMHGHGAGGYVAQKSRNVYLSQPEDAVYEYWDYCLKAHRFTASLMKPGADLQAVKQEVNRYLQEALGCEPNRAGFCRGLGSFWSEQPNMDSRDCLRLEENMVFMLQPRITKNGYSSMCQETYIVGPDGAWCPSRFPMEIVVLL